MFLSLYTIAVRLFAIEKQARCQIITTTKIGEEEEKKTS